MDELLGRRAPHSAQAEQAVLGSMLIDPNCIPEVIGKVKSADFYIQTNREIFETMFSMFSFGRTIDPVTVLGELKVRGVYKENSSEQYLGELMEITPTAANVMEYAAIVADRALLRALARLALERGCGRLEWACLDWNRPSIDFYLSLGAAPQSDWTTYRLTDMTLEAMAK